MSWIDTVFNFTGYMTAAGPGTMTMRLTMESGYGNISTVFKLPCEAEVWRP